MRSTNGRIVPVFRILTACTLLQSYSLCRADIVTLSTGGLVRGSLTEPLARVGLQSSSRAVNGRNAPTIAIATLTGGRVIVESSQVRTVVRRPVVVEEFEWRVRRTAPDIDPLWSLAEWCRTKGLKTQREEVLRRILVLDPDHVRAHQGLGEVRYDGRWKTYDEEMRSRGFVKFQGRYVTPQEIEIKKSQQSRRRIEHEWTDRIRSWSHAFFSEDGEKRRRGRAQLLNVADSKAIPGLNRILRASDNEEARELYVRILARIPGPEPIPFLVQQSLFDASKSVRVTAQEIIAPDYRDAACPLYARELHNSDNDIVRRAALMLEKIGDEKSVLPLIEALVTTHQVPTQVVDNSNLYSFGRNGPVGNPDVLPLPTDVAGKLATGQYPNGVIVVPPPDFANRTKTVLVNREFRNSEALSALESLTKQSFGYDKDQWRRWWAARTATGVAKTSGAP